MHLLRINMILLAKCFAKKNNNLQVVAKALLERAAIFNSQKLNILINTMY
jgi:hypothetical protein